MARRRICLPLPTLRELAVTAGVGAVVSLPVLRTWSLQWGSTEAELDATLPGDELLARVDHTSTRAVDINARPETVWPWLVQMGQGRGGFYSFDALEKAVGLDITSADRIEPQWQDLAVGDPVHLAPEFALRVALLEAPRAMVWLGADGGDPTGSEPTGSESTGSEPTGTESTGSAGDVMPFEFSWAFVLTESAPGRTRLVVRERYRYLTGWARFMVEPASMVSFLMSSKMLRGIRDRAEGAA